MKLALDRYGRLRLNADITHHFGIYGKLGAVYLAVDPANHVIAVRKYSVLRRTPGAYLFNVDKRGYVRADWLYAKLALHKADGPFQFEYAGDIDSQKARWLTFSLAQLNRSQ